LDEIGDTPQFIQVKLLRVLQFYEFERVGGDKTIKSDFRLICATNQNLGEKITAGAFRDDLFYRINVFEIEMPPLRERKDDLPLLLSHFVQIFNEKTNRRVIGFSPEAMQVLNDYDWPGNLRELKNLVERVFVYCKDSLVGLKDLPPNVLSKSPASETNFLPLPLWNLDNIEKIVIEKCFAQCSYNITKTAELLGITRSTLYSKLKKHGIFSAEEDESV
jgi:DNA-binding NtrC family response regulator